jgi:hypothetical protein
MGSQVRPNENLYTVLNLTFPFVYFGTVYTDVSVNMNGYVCLGINSACNQIIRPTPHDIIVGLNYFLDPTRNDSGKIYSKNLTIDTPEFAYNKMYVNLMDSHFSPTNTFMITYDDVLSFDAISKSKVSFQIFLSTDSKKSYVTFKFKSCPLDLALRSSTGINHKINHEVSIDYDQQCSSSNIGQTGVWIIEVTSLTSGKEIGLIFLSLNLDSFF